MNKFPSVANEYMSALELISRGLTSYTYLNGTMKEVPSTSGDLIFFSRQFLREKRWSIIPLWEADLRALCLEDGSRVQFMNVVRRHCLQKGCQHMHYLTVDKMKKWWYPDFSNFAIAHKKIDLRADDPNQFFEIREPGHMPPYQGNNFFWAGDESLAIYTDGDNLAFVTGDRLEIESLLGVSYRYCVDRFLYINTAYSTTPSLLRAFENFCDEHIK
jgi:hypothetical protein